MHKRMISTKEESLCAGVEFSQCPFSHMYELLVKAGTNNTVVDADDAVDLDAHHTMLSEVSGTEP